ncbi:hypothetical protein ES754_03520 [Psychrobacter frigidicola]|uniref:Uncharacterized protein n=1 Tax=Psychrobacter frigidicola TaxID=45611 RepID=A0A5C7A479_9GAMM|nr:hypothetical protein [Psychrobacter frigidicola]TXD98032.1 hypothetical protein ES754_03520 [Psychrobacter frigidicola]
MDKQEIMDYIINNDEIDIYYQYLIGQNVWYFKNFSDDSSTDYDEFKKFISRNLGVPFNNISIVGSAKTKYSFSPKKKFKTFDDNSDFDLIIVSNEIFMNIWKAYRQVAQGQYLTGHKSKCSNIFNGFISLNDSDPTYGNNVLENWQRKVLTFKAELQLRFNIRHEVNYRIYSDWESVQDYHMKGIEKLKEDLNEVD